MLDLPRFGCINVHGSVLPRWRGAAPIAAAILAGDVEVGVSIMRMDAGVDTGPMLSAAYLPIAADDTTGTLTPKLASLGADLLVRTLPRWLAGELTPLPQPDEGVTWAPRITKEDGLIDWSEPAALIERRVRAYQPWPTAYTRWNGLGLKVLRAWRVRNRRQESGVRERGQGSGVGAGDRDDYCRKGGKCGGGDGNGRAVAGGGAVGRQTGDADRRVPSRVRAGLWGAGSPLGLFRILAARAPCEVPPTGGGGAASDSK